MRIAVTDACIFIDMLELDITSSFFRLNLEIHTTVEVVDELFSEQQEILKAYQTVDKLTVHNLTAKDLLAIQAIPFPKALSSQDRSVIYLASQLHAMILSSDNVVRKFAQRESIEVHGMFWIFDQLVDEMLLSRPDAIHKLQKLMEDNLMYRNNLLLRKEAQRRIDGWKE